MRERQSRRRHYEGGGRYCQQSFRLYFPAPYVTLVFIPQHDEDDRPARTALLLIDMQRAWLAPAPIWIIPARPRIMSIARRRGAYVESLQSLSEAELMVSAASATSWPAAVEVLNESGRSPFVLICEHASNYIPAEYHKLGLDDRELERHIAWDIGAANVTRALSRRLDASAFLGCYSRLLIDLNRPLHVADSIPLRSEATDIPGNLSLGGAEKERRQRYIFHPFQDRLRAHVEKRTANGRRNVLVAVHSFTPVYFGQQRSWHAGVLFDKADQLGHALIAQLSSDRSLNVGANVPYGVSADADYALVVHGDQLGNPAVLLEIRNDLIADLDGVETWTGKIEDALRAVESLA